MVDNQEKLFVVLDEMYRDTAGNIILIVGEVLSDTVEYEHGLRFFDGSGIMYREDGSTNGILELNLVKEVPADETSQFIGCREMYALDVADTKPERFIPVTSPNFAWSVFGKYINRMGMETGYTATAFNQIGQLYSGHKSMEDILYQVVGYPPAEV
jgi:hypothetical protein